MWALTHPAPHLDASFQQPLENSQLLGMCVEELFGFAFSCVLTQWLFLRETNVFYKWFFVVTRTENRANNLMREENFEPKALKLATVLLKQPALLKLRAVV